MPDWPAFVAVRLRVDRLQPERQARVVREIATQLDDLYRDALERGLTAAEAEAVAANHVRDWDRLSEDVWRAERSRHARPGIERAADAIERQFPRRGAATMLSDLLRDLRYAVRQFAASPGFAAVAIATMALGIGATTAIFSVVNGVLLRPLPYADPGALVRVHEVVPEYGRFAVAPGNFLDWRRQTNAFERIAAYSVTNASYVTTEGPERLPGATISWDLLPLLGVSPALGRDFREDEDAPGKNAVIVLSHGTWQRRFGGDPAVLGRTIVLSSLPVTIVGVMPPGFYFPARDTEYWQPMALNPANAQRGGHYLGVVARLKPAVSADAAGAQMRALAERLATEFPATNAGESAEVVPLHEHIVGSVRPALLTLLGSVVVVVLIACANVANLLLVRASARSKEIAIRRAIGAGAARLTQQMLVESIVLAASGGALGVALAFAALPAIRTLGAGSIPRVADISVDIPVLMFAGLLSVVTGLLFGLAPAWQASRLAVTEALKEGGRSSSASGGRRVRSALLVAEVALSIVLLVGATLLLRSFARLTRVDPGFRADGVLAFRVALPQTAYADDAKRLAFYDRLLAGLGQLPGVTAAGLVQTLPMRGDYVLNFAVQGRPAPAPGKEPSANYRTITPDYFKALAIPLRRGRAFTDRDREGTPLVAVVDDAFARKYFPDEDPIGRGIHVGNGTDGFAQIVGVVGDVHYDGLDANAGPTLYVPLRQDVFSSMWVLTRATDAASLAPAARQMLRGIDPSMPATSISAMSDVVSESVATRRFSMLLVATFAATALFLAAVGLYGVVAYTVSLRTSEIGLRLAMGAQPGQVLAMIVGGGMRLVAIGLAIGLGGAMVLSRVMRTQLSPLLFQTTPFDGWSYAATAAALLAAAAIACLMPARRAMRVDPIVALRQS